MGCDLTKWLARLACLPRCEYPIRIAAGPPYIIAVQVQTDFFIELLNVYLDYETTWIRRGRLRPVPHPPVHGRLQDAQRKEEECRAALNYFFSSTFVKDTRPSIRHRYLIIFSFFLSMLFLEFLRRINTADHFRHVLPKMPFLLCQFPRFMQVSVEFAEKYSFRINILLKLQKICARKSSC
jgi:hypothetical protein